MNDSSQQELDHLRARRDRLAHEIEMTENTIAHWNRVHPAEEPIDAVHLLAEPREILAGIDRKLGLSPDQEPPIGIAPTDTPGGGK